MLRIAPLRLLFGCAIFLASFLLFLVEPMAAKQLLPIFGGSAAVWITCLVFFQTALLCAYLYAHWLSLRSRSTQSMGWPFHLSILLLATFVAIQWARLATGSVQWVQHPVLSIFFELGMALFLPFLMLGATSPLLQVWFSRLQPGGVPYRLYALSNLASLLALALYPTVIEPFFNLRIQRIAWACGFAAFAALSGAVALKTRSAAQAQKPAIVPNQPPPAPTPLPRKLLWLLLPMGASMQLAAVTSHITENIAAIPLLWILPLATYLITLILAFQFPGLLLPLPRLITTRLLAVLLAGLGYMLSKPEGSLPLKIALFFFLAELFIACLFLHSEACALRPQRSSETTLFYLLFAAGGALGSFLIGIVSPLLFSFNYDLAISFTVTAALALAVLWTSGWAPRLLWMTATLLLAVLVGLLHIASQRDTPVAVRNFYGGLRVRQKVGYPGATIRTLSNGTIQHGSEIFSDDLRDTPTTYYAADSGVGLAMRFCCQDQPSSPSRNSGRTFGRTFGIVGLGAGTLAAYGQANDRITFYEINPAVLPIAQNVFAYIRDATQRGASIRILEGDARTTLASQPPQRFDVLVIDAFSGDAIPLHLLTTQALDLYKQHLAPGGILAFHISNQHVDLEPEIALLAKAANLKAMTVTNPPNDERGELPATWVLLSNSPTFFRTPQVFNTAKTPVENPKVRLWTDNYSSLLPVLHW